MKPDAYSGEARLGRIRDKEAVINELSYVDPMTPSLGETVKKLRDKLYACGSCGHDDNVRLKNEFESVADGLFKKRDSIREEYKRQNEGIILEAERLALNRHLTVYMRMLKMTMRKGKESRQTLSIKRNFWFVRRKVFHIVLTLRMQRIR